MSEHDEPTAEHDPEIYEEVPPRSIFAATWFRVLLVVIVIGVIGAVAIPYVLDVMNPPPTKPAVVARPPSAPVAIPATPPATPPATSSMPATPAADKAASTGVPASTATTDKKAAPAAARPAESKPEPKAAATPAEPGKSAMAVSDATPAKPPTPAAKAAPPAKPEPAAKTETSSRPEVAAKKDAATEASKPAPKETTKPADVAAKPESAPKRAAATASTTGSTTATKPATASGPFWVQVGAFRDAETAKRVATKLRDDNFKVEESVTKAGGVPPKTAAAKPAVPAGTETSADNYDVFVSGQSSEELNKKLSAKGLAAEASGNGMVVKPSLPLRDAVALSKDLALEGFKVQVRRAGAPAGSATAPSTVSTSPPTGEGGTELHRVRVGGFPDRATAQDTARQLEAKGYKVYIARGDQ